MEGFIGFIVGVVIIVIVYFIANFIANLDEEKVFDRYVSNDSGYPYANEHYFESKYKSDFYLYTKVGLTDKQAYQKIIVKQDEKLLDRYRWILFWAMLTFVAFGSGVAVA
jgi:hypothetical protein